MGIAEYGGRFSWADASVLGRQDNHYDHTRGISDFRGDLAISRREEIARILCSGSF